jgi:hypothetical protein
VAEGGGLLNRYTVISRIVGSNPIPSATYLILLQEFQKEPKYFPRFCPYINREFRRMYAKRKPGRSRALLVLTAGVA